MELGMFSAAMHLSPVICGLEQAHTQHPTETFALGINMPARTVVFTALRK